MSAKFPKYHRLDSLKTISELFKKGNAFIIYPFKFIILTIDAGGPAPLQLLISVPKRNIKKAVQRNRIKRLVREVYRTNNETLIHKAKECQHQYAMAIIFIGNQEPVYDEVESKLKTALNKLTNNYISL